MKTSSPAEFKWSLSNSKVLQMGGPGCHHILYLLNCSRCFGRRKQRTLPSVPVLPSNHFPCQGRALEYCTSARLTTTGGANGETFPAGMSWWTAYHSSMQSQAEWRAKTMQNLLCPRRKPQILEASGLLIPPLHKH